MHQRISWLLAFNALMFAALGFAWGKPNTADLIRVLCTIGGAVCVVSYWLLVLAGFARVRLQGVWAKHFPMGESGPGLVGTSWYGPRNKVTEMIVTLFWGENWFPILLLYGWIKIYKIAIP